MPDTASWWAFAAISLGMVLTPGPNMIYVISRSLCQGRMAGLISLGGGGLGVCVLYAVRRLGDYGCGDGGTLCL